MTTCRTIIFLIVTGKHIYYKLYEFHLLHLILSFYLFKIINIIIFGFIITITISTVEHHKTLTRPLTQQLTAIFGLVGSVARPVLSRPLNVPVCSTAYEHYT